MHQSYYIVLMDFSFTHGSQHRAQPGSLPPGTAPSLLLAALPLQVQVPAWAGGMPGSLAPGALRDMDKAAFCASTHPKRWPQAALAGSPLSLPVQVPGQAQAQARTPSTPPVWPQSSISKMPHLVSLSLTFSYISPRPPGPLPVSSFPSPGRFIFQVAGHFLSFKAFRYLAFLFLLHSLYHPFFHHERHSTFLRGSYITYTFFSKVLRYHRCIYLQPS